MISDELLAEQKIRFLPSTLSQAAHSKVRTISTFPSFIDAIDYKIPHSFNNSFSERRR